MARKKANIHYIYKTTCNVTGRWYVGMHSTCNLNDGYMGSGLRLRRSIRKYGVENHTKEILEFLPTREELVLREIEIVTKELILDDNCMNLKEGGTGGFFNLESSTKGGSTSGNIHKNKLINDVEYFKKHIQYATINITNFNKTGVKHKNFEGQTHSEETKKLMSEQRKGNGTGETNSQFGTCWITKDGVNKKIKKEEIIKWTSEGWVKGRN